MDLKKKKNKLQETRTYNYISRNEKKKKEG